MNRIDQLRRLQKVLYSIAVVYFTVMASIIISLMAGWLDFEFKSIFIVYIAIFPGSMVSIAAALTTQIQQEQEKNRQESQNNIKIGGDL